MRRLSRRCADYSRHATNCFGLAAPGNRPICNSILSFFFSSRRRHTRWTGDWSSDVCSSDLDRDRDGSNNISLRLPSRARYTPGSDDKVHVTGDPQILAHMRVRDGSIELDCDNSWHDRTPVTITLPGQEFKKFSVNGSSQLVLQNLDQMMVKINVSGSGSVKADGKVEHADIRVSGSGDADLSQLKANIATVRISGSGSSAIAPIDEA